MGPHDLGDARPVDNPGGGVMVETMTVAADEDGALAALTDSQVGRPGRPRSRRRGDHLAALAQHGQGAMPAFEGEGFDVGPASFGYPQPVERQ